MPTPKGQAAAEFALIIVVLFLLIFVILDTSRILFAWLTVQNSARDGARYAITGRDDCLAGQRTDCVVAASMDTLDALPLNEDPNALYEEDNYYLIEVFGVTDEGTLQENYAGAPGQHVAVRVTYRVPVITPLLQPIAESLSVHGQVTLVNENFGSLGGSSVGVGLPPPPPDYPTPGPTPTPTATPTIGPTPTGTATATGTATPTATRCDTRFEDVLVEGRPYVDVTGEQSGTGIIVYDTTLATPAVIGTAVFDGPFDGHACSGFVRAPVAPPLQGNHLIVVRNNDDNSSDTALVIPGTATPTPTPSSTPTLPPAPTPTASVTATATPVGPALEVDPVCGFTPQVQFTLTGFNWPASETVNLYWREQGGTAAFQGVANGPAFQQSWTVPNVGDGLHTIEARSLSYVRVINFQVPCLHITATPPAATATPTMAPADLQIGQPSLLSTRPIVAHRPLEIQVVISNTGSTEVSTQFFTDIYFDPPSSAIFTNTIDLAYSSGYQGLSIMPPASTRVLTITAPLGFSSNATGIHDVYAVVDSLDQIDELLETNNIAAPLQVVDVTPAASPTPSPTPSGSTALSGLVFAYVGNWAPQFRTQVWLVNSSTGNIVAGPTASNSDGYYSFAGVPPASYDLYACIMINGQSYVGSRTGVVPPDPYADLFMQVDPTGCPY